MQASMPRRINYLRMSITDRCNLRCGYCTYWQEFERLPPGEILYTLKEAQILIECWRRDDNTIRPHSALGYRPPAPGAIQVQARDPGYAMLRQDLWLDLTSILT